MEPNQTTTQDNTEIEVNPQSQQIIEAPKLKVVNESESSMQDFKAHFEKAKQGYVIKLPVCGLNVRVTTPDLMNMVIGENFPQEMVQSALELKGLAPKTAANEMSRDKLIKMMGFVDDFFCGAVISPKFTKDIQNNPEMIDIHLIDFQDKLVVIELINRGVDALSTFRPKADR